MYIHIDIFFKAIFITGHAIRVTCIIQLFGFQDEGYLYFFRIEYAINTALNGILR
jgi:hypothetical protein